MSEAQQEMKQIFLTYKALAKVKKNNEERRQDVQNYIGAIQMLIGKYGDAPIKNTYTLYGGHSLNQEAEIAQERLGR